MTYEKLASVLLFLSLPFDDSRQVAHNQRLADVNERSGFAMTLVHDIGVLEMVHE
jgi:hypothetical protein